MQVETIQSFRVPNNGVGVEVYLKTRQSLKHVSCYCESHLDLDWLCVSIYNFDLRLWVKGLVCIYVWGFICVVTDKFVLGFSGLNRLFLLLLAAQGFGQCTAFGILLLLRWRKYTEFPLESTEKICIGQYRNTPSILIIWPNKFNNFYSFHWYTGGLMESVWE